MVARLTVAHHFRLDDRHNAGFLAEHGVARERVGVGTDVVSRRGNVVDGDHGTPFGKPGTEAGIVGEPLAKAIEAFGDLLAAFTGHREGATVDLDAGNHISIGQDGAERRAVLGGLLQRFFGEDDAGDVAGHRLAGAEQHLAVVAAQFQRVRQVDLGEPLGDGGGGFVGSQNALAGLHQLLGDSVQRLGHLGPRGE